MEPRKGFKFITCMPNNEPIVSMLVHNDIVFIATTKSVYTFINNVLTCVEFEIKEEV